MEKIVLINLIRNKPIILGVTIKTVLYMMMTNMLLIWEKMIIVSI